MTLQEIDHAITGWNTQLGAAAQNLVDLQDLPVYQRLAGTNGVPKAELTGETAAAVAPALDTIGRLLQYFDLLRHTLIRAEDLRRDIPMFKTEQRIKEIEQVLTSASIELPAQPVPLNQRSLLSGVQNIPSICPADLLKLMAQEFEQVKRVVLTVDAAWEGLGRRVEDTLESIENLRREADDAGLAELDAAAKTIEAARKKGEADPLAASGDFERLVAPVVTRVRSRVEELRRLHLQIESALIGCRATLQMLETVHRDAVAAHAEAGEKVQTVALPAPSPDATVTALRDWLGRLETKYREGTLAPIATGVRNWNKAAEDCVSSERRVLLANRAPLELRAELRGRMDALKAKARGRGVAEDPDLCRLAEEARALLYTRPTPLDRAASAVGSYEKHLNAIA